MRLFLLAPGGHQPRFSQPGVRVTTEVCARPAGRAYFKRKPHSWIKGSWITIPGDCCVPNRSDHRSVAVLPHSEQQCRSRGSDSVFRHLCFRRNAEDVFLPRDVLPQSPSTRRGVDISRSGGTDRHRQVPGIVERRASLLPNRGCVFDEDADPAAQTVHRSTGEPGTIRRRRRSSANSMGRVST